MNTKANQLKTRPKFTITKTFLNTLNIDYLGASSLIFDTYSNLKTDTLDVKVHSKQTDEDSLYLVETRVSTTSSTEDDLFIHRLSFIYGAFVKINDEELDSNSIHSILSKTVPNHLFNNINSIVFNVTNATGYPLILDKKSFIDSIKDNGLKSIINELVLLKSAMEHYKPNINYQWIINELSSGKEFAKFLSVLNDSMGANVTDHYETLPTYNYYLRFFIPIEYHHPDYKECDESVWLMLFQLLFGNHNATCRVIDVNGGFPEIEFCYMYFEEVYISDLPLEDITELLENLINDLFANASVELWAYQNINSQYNMTLPNDRLIRRKEFFKLYGFDNVELIPNKELDFLEKMYSRIKNCDIQTILYRY